MAEHEGIKKALSHKPGKTHTHAVRYERAHNGGFHAHVEKKHEDGSHSHDEHHVLMSPEDAASHMDEHLGDQPAVGGGGEPDEEAAEGATGAGAAGAGAPPPAGGPSQLMQ